MVHIGVVSGWQTVNIGDVAHTPGTLTALLRHDPDARVTLLALSLDQRERDMLTRYFPTVEVVTGRLSDAEWAPEVERFAAEVDVLVHGSGPDMVAHREVAAWRSRTGKPYGFFGITVDPLRPYIGPLDLSATMIDSVSGDLVPADRRELLDGAAFVYCRDVLTATFLQAQGIRSEVVTFGPDATVLCDFYDDADGAAVLAEYGLVEGEFICAVPRLRFTPYHEIRGYEPQADDLRKAAYSAGYREHDLAALRRGIVAWVRRTGHPALVVPEMSYAVEFAQAHLAGAFPEDVADKVHVLPRFWELQEAAAVYRRAAGVLSSECHSPLIAIAEGVPAIYLRQPTDTIKGAMYAGLGLGDWVIELESADPGAAVERAIQRWVDDPAASKQDSQQGRDRGRALLDSMAATVRAAAAAPVTA
ncbi:polysaccharide pyruvyl transferase family protein [Propionibacteriaceae bacterium Y2011]|uniref:polysaccharide pyruvyl transferase family protein n=1 Tax=Microlunatus sp. Y2014 TaxID=3418488 RepID=UPI003B460356